MSATHRFATIGDIAAFRQRGSMPIDQAIWLVKSATESAHEQQIRKLRVVATGLDGFESPSFATRHVLAREWAGATGGAVQVAVVVKPEMIDPQKVGVGVATNFGALANAFTTETDARVASRNPLIALLILQAQSRSRRAGPRRRTRRNPPAREFDHRRLPRRMDNSLVSA